jgi:hypothetical protein
MTTSALTGIRLELAAAVRRVNAAYARVPEDSWPLVDDERWRTLEAEIDAAIGSEDRARALAAIEAWESHALEALGAPA